MKKFEKGDAKLVNDASDEVNKNLERVKEISLDVVSQVSMSFTRIKQTIMQVESKIRSTQKRDGQKQDLPSLPSINKFNSMLKSMHSVREEPKSSDQSPDNTQKQPQI